MEYAPDLLVPVDTVNPTAKLPGRRLHYRQKISTLAYVNLDHTNGGIVRDLSQAGLAIQSVTPLRLNQQVQLRFDLLRPRLHIESLGRVAWADPRGQAGVQFLNLDDRSHRLLKQWIFTQLLARAHQVAETGFIFSPGDPGEAAAQLLFSAPSRTAIRLEPEAHSGSSSLLDQSLPDQKNSAATLRLHWFPFPVPHRVLAHIVDGLILISALLLFSVLAMAVTQMFPSWLVAAALALVMTCVFATLYWFLFVAWMGATPGARLAQLASSDSVVGEEEEDRARFR
jgi:hypothetical protein